MSLDRPTRDTDTAPIPKVRTHERRRAAIWLAGLAAAAVVLVAIMLAVLGNSDGSPGPSQVGEPTGPAVVVTSSTPPAPTSTVATTSPPAKPRTSASSPTGPSNRQVSCPTSAPCALPDDIGDVVGALNAYRASKHLPAVTGKVTPGAQTCAVSAASNCPSGFFWEPVGRDGAQVVDKIVSSGRGGDRLLDPALKTIQVGWAYIPQSKSFECAVVIGA